MGSAVIFSGTKVKTLKGAIDLNGGNDIISSTTDPTASAVSANIGSLLLNSSNGKLYRKNDSGSSTNWTEVGASGQAGINYISNPNADLNTTGWSTYADAAGSAPVDGTGGSPNVTWTRSTAVSATTPTTPLRGAANFVFAKDAANRQGQGVSVDFTIDKADQAKPLTVTFDYQVLTGTYATGDLTVYLIADPAGTPVVIQPAGYQIQSAVAGTKMRNIALFQTQASGVSYRLCFHVASTSASAYDLAIDNVVVGPQVVQYGAPVTDWQSYTLIIGGSSSAPTQGTTVRKNAWWRRNGDSMEIRFEYEQSTGGANGSGTYLFPLPSGFSIDTNKMTTNTAGCEEVCGFASISASSTGTGNYSPMGLVFPYNSTNLAIVYDNNVTEGNTILGSANYGLGTQTILSITYYAQIPIAGWSSTVVMSNDTDTRVVGAFYRASANCAGSTSQDINFDTKMYDTHGAVTASAAGTGSWKFTAPVPGLYSVKGNLAFTAATQSEVQLFKNGTLYQKNIGWVIAANGQGSFVAEIELLAGDYIAIRTSASITVVGGALNTTIGTISVHRLSGPSAIAASESINAKYYTTAAPTVNNTTPKVTFGTKVWDSHNAYSSGDYTVPVSGKYRVSGFVRTASGAWLAGYVLYMYAYKGSTGYTMGGQRVSANITSVLECGGSVLIDCVAGDVLSGRVYSDLSVALDTSTGQWNWISFERVGN